MKQIITKEEKICKNCKHLIRFEDEDTSCDEIQDKRLVYQEYWSGATIIVDEDFGCILFEKKINCDVG